jgi:hypothetical protein
MEIKLVMNSEDIYGIAPFLKDYPGMSLAPSRSSSIILKGTFAFAANPECSPEITDSYELQITIPETFPNALPTVKEIENRIPRDGKHHIERDDTLCLGSPIRILAKVSEQPSLVGFAETCIVPFLYAVSYKREHGGDFILGELAHGKKGIVDDYIELFGVKNREQVLQTLKLLGMKRRIANKSASSTRKYSGTELWLHDPGLTVMHRVLGLNCEGDFPGRR